MSVPFPLHKFRKKSDEPSFGVSCCVFASTTLHSVGNFRARDFMLLTHGIRFCYTQPSRVLSSVLLSDSPCRSSRNISSSNITRTASNPLYVLFDRLVMDRPTTVDYIESSAPTHRQEQRRVPGSSYLGGRPEAFASNDKPDEVQERKCCQKGRGRPATGR